MSGLEEEYVEYLTENGILPRLLDILKQVIDATPPPPDPLMYILHALGCPLIPQAQMKALERKVSRAHDELRFLRRQVIALGASDQLYDSDSDLDEYVGAVQETSSSQLDISFEDDYPEVPGPQSQFGTEGEAMVPVDQADQKEDATLECSQDQYESESCA